MDHVTEPPTVNVSCRIFWRDGGYKTRRSSFWSNCNNMSRSPSRFRRRPRRSAQSHNFLISTSVFFLVFISLILLCPVGTKAEPTPRPEYGTVIGIGNCFISPTRNLRHADRFGADLGTTQVINVISRQT